MSMSSPSTSTAQVSSSTTIAKSPRTKLLKSKSIALRLSPLKLAMFPHEKKPVESKPPSPDSLPDSTSTLSVAPTTIAPPLKASESADTLTTGVAAPANDLLDVSGQLKRKGIPGPKPGSKRTFAQTGDGAPKPRGKPGPKKKPRPGEMVDGQPYTGPAPVSTVKLNPKASTGAINERLRQLDRTGKPCRKWARRGFSVKSFTGSTWTTASWKAPPKRILENIADVKSDSSSDVVKINLDSSAVPSEDGTKSATGDALMIGVPDVRSSPMAAIEAST